MPAKLAMFHALPPYFGGKRSLVGEIFKHVPPPAQAPVFIDAFLGGGSVSLYAKARGYRVIANDIALRSHIVGKALIENSRVTIATEDVVRLFVPNARAGDFVQRCFSPDAFTRKHARFLDLALANVGEMDEEKRWLMQLLVVKYMFRMRPMGNFGAKTIVHQLEAGDWDEMNPNYVREALNRRINCHPKRNAEILAREINRGVFANGQANEAIQGDVFDLLDRVRGDVAYFDPPYYGTMSYESALKPVDDILRGEERPAERSVFSQEGAMRFIDRLFEKARHVPLWVMSFGNARVSLEELVALMKKHRSRVEARAIEYVHCTGLVGEERKRANREFILVGEA